MIIIIITRLSALLSRDCNFFSFVVCLFVCFSSAMESNCYLPC